MYEALLVRKEIQKPSPSIPESFLALIRELQALGLDFSMKKFENGFYSTTDTKEIEKDIFQDLEVRLKLRALLARKKAEEFAKAKNISDKIDTFLIEKNLEKQKILENLLQQKEKSI
jgi:DNA-directed RNA polymerase beta subunit